MEERVKQRLVGATVLVALVVILAPMVLDRELEPDEGAGASQIPPRPAHTRESRVLPVREVEILGPAGSSWQRQATAPPAPVAKPPPAPVAKRPPVPVAKRPPVPVAKRPPVPVAVAAPAVSSGAEPATGSVPEATGLGKAASREQPRGPGDSRSQETRQEQSGLTAWAVQLGSFSNSANAVALRDSLRSKGYAAFLESVRVKKGRVTRLYVGPELLRAKATASRKRLEKEVNLKGIVVRYPTG